MQKDVITVVLPIYNVEKYLDRCLDRIVNQTYKNLEIILVDDGATDNCPSMCDEWAKKDSRIKVIHKKNAGLGMARNTGIENATGEYICFFDSDDYVDFDALEKCYNALKKEDADVVCFGRKNIDRNGNESGRLVPDVDKYVYSGDEVLEEFLPILIAPDPVSGRDSKLRMNAWSTVYSLKTIKDANWEFVSERKIISEDVYSLLSFYKYVNRVVVLPEALYCYCENETSLTRTYREDRYEKIKIFYNESVKLAESLGYGDDIKHRISHPYLSNTIAALKQEVAAGKDKKSAIKRIKYIGDDDVLQAVLKSNKKDNVGLNRKMLFWCLRNKHYRICYLLLSWKL
ncbi:MAG: glycosyltransferase [Ruminococcus sp.]|nr:glycosyltransferase [Ruminococcus sp.]